MSTWRGDLIVIAACAAGVAASGGAFAPPAGAARVALVETRGGGRHALPLSHDARLTVDGRRGATTVEVRDGRARILASSCPQKLCVRAGWLEQAGDATACVPNGVSLRLVGGDPIHDAVTR